VVARRLSGDSFGGYRARLMETLRAKGIRDLAILRAFAETPRHLFVPEAVRHRAYEDTALPIGNGQTISQPFTQARYLEALKLTGKERVLEVGTGSGYQAAVLARLGAEVFTVERQALLGRRARENWARAGVNGIAQKVGDGTLGWAQDAPFDARHPVKRLRPLPSGRVRVGPLLALTAARGEPLVLPMDLPQLMAAIRRARFFIGGDTGPLHLAVALGTPVVGLYGPTDPARNGPYSRADVVVSNARPGEITYKRSDRHANSMLSITVDQVLAAVERRLEKGR